MTYRESATFGKKGYGYKMVNDVDAYCGECIHFLSGAGCTKRGLSFVRFETSAMFCDDFVDVDTVME